MLTVLCHLKTGPFVDGVSCDTDRWLGEELRHEGIEVQGRAEGVRHQSGRGINASSGDQPYYLLQLSERRYAGPLLSEMRRLRELEDENSRLKKIFTDLTLDHQMLQDVI